MCVCVCVIVCVGVSKTTYKKGERERGGGGREGGRERERASAREKKGECRQYYQILKWKQNCDECSDTSPAINSLHLSSPKTTPQNKQEPH